MYHVRNPPRCAPLRRVETQTPRLVALLIPGLGIAALGLGVLLADVGLGGASEQTPSHARPELKAGPGSPAQVYRSTCLRCHDSDGRGEAIRDTFPSIPDFTNTDWHASRTDQDLGRAILDGKGRAMKPMKKKLGSLDVMQMVSFVRAFRGGGVVVLEEESAPDSTETAAEVTPPGDLRVKPDPPTGPPARPAVALAAPSPAARPAGTSSSSDKPRSRVAAELYGKHCLACHGKNGRGGNVRETMPSIPDFSLRQWQMSRNNAQLAVSILDGRGSMMPAWRGRLSVEQVRELAAYVRTFGTASLSATEAPTSEFGNRFRQLKARFDEMEKQSQVLSRP